MIGLAGGGQAIGLLVAPVALVGPGRQGVAGVDRGLQPRHQPGEAVAEMRFEQRDRVPTAHQRLHGVVQQLAQRLAVGQLRSWCDTA